MGLFEDCALSFRFIAFAAIVPLLVRLPIRKLEALLEPRGCRPYDAVGASRVLRLSDGLFRRFRHLLSRPCLIRGVTLFYFLRRAGMEVSLVFGIGEVKGRQAGHCWLCKEGRPFLESEDPLAHFVPMYEFNSRHIERPIGLFPCETTGRP